MFLYALKCPLQKLLMLFYSYALNFGLSERDGFIHSFLTETGLTCRKMISTMPQIILITLYDVHTTHQGVSVPCPADDVWRSY